MASSIRRLLLVGFMGSGKSTVGRSLARTLGWPFHDFDDTVEEEEGRSIARIFSESGEAYFRAVEDRVARRLLDAEPAVLAAGGGWAAVPGRLRTVPPGTCSVWLKVSAEEAVRRAEAQPGSRPLLQGTDVLEVARTLLNERTPRYAECDVKVDTEGQTVEDVSARILERVGLIPENDSALETR